MSSEIEDVLDVPYNSSLEVDPVTLLLLVLTSAELLWLGLFGGV